jgi:hypothetical protein
MEIVNIEREIRGIPEWSSNKALEFSTIPSV